MGSAACDAAARYCLEVLHRPSRYMATYPPPRYISSPSRYCLEVLHRPSRAGGPVAPPPLRILDPFCGEGSVLAAANALGVDAVGIDSSRKRCRHAAAYVRARAEPAAG